MTLSTHIPEDSSNEPQPVMTEEQLRFFGHQTRQAVDSALKRYVRRATVGFVVLLGGLGYSLYASNQDSTDARKAIVASGRAISVDGCNRDFNTIDIFRYRVALQAGSLEKFRKEGTLSTAQYHRSLTDIRETIHDLVLPNCVKALTVVTDNPSAKIRIPAPKRFSDARKLPPIPDG